MKEYITIQTKVLNGRAGIRIFEQNGEYYIFNMYSHLIVMFLPFMGYILKYKLFKISQKELEELLHKQNGYSDKYGDGANGKTMQQNSSSTGTKIFRGGGIGYLIVTLLGKYLLKLDYPFWVGKMIPIVSLILLILYLITDFLYQGKINMSSFEYEQKIRIKPDTNSGSLIILLWLFFLFVGLETFFIAILSENLFINIGALFFILLPFMGGKDIMGMSSCKIYLVEEEK